MEQQDVWDLLQTHLWGGGGLGIWPQLNIVEVQEGA